MEILITSKTHKGHAACVGGMIISNNRLVRILNPGNHDQIETTDFKIGDIWEIEFENRIDVIPPHIEDIIISKKKYLRHVEIISDFILHSGVEIYRGSPSIIFNGKLGWTGNGGGYIENKGNLPNNSVGFWISDKNLEFNDGYYHYHSENIFIQDKRLKYVGFQTTTQIIPAGTLMRVSLARWWKPEDADIHDRCYLQLSGWYELA
jgi:hypothetical protein